MNQRPPSGLTPGFLLITLGLGLLLREFHFFPRQVRFIDFWPLVLLAFSLSHLFRAEGLGGRLFALAILSFGAVLLAGNLGFLTFPTARLWPALLVVLGVALLFRPRCDGARLGHFHHHHHHKARCYAPYGGGFAAGDAHSEGIEPPRRPERSGILADGAQEEHVTQDRLNRNVTLSGAQIRVDSQAWLGGELSATFAGVELDLRRAKLAEGGAVLDLRVLLGGIEIRVPDTWSVVCDVSPMLGGVDNDTREPPGAVNPPRLTVVGTVTVGGVNIRC